MAEHLAERDDVETVANGNEYAHDERVVIPTDGPARNPPKTLSMNYAESPTAPTLPTSSGGRSCAGIDISDVVADAPFYLQRLAYRCYYDHGVPTPCYLSPLWVSLPI